MSLHYRLCLILYWLVMPLEIHPLTGTGCWGNTWTFIWLLYDFFMTLSFISSSNFYRYHFFVILLYLFCCCSYYYLFYRLTKRAIQNQFSVNQVFPGNHKWLILIQTGFLHSFLDTHFLPKFVHEPCMNGARVEWLWQDWHVTMLLSSWSEQTVLRVKLFPLNWLSREIILCASRHQMSWFNQDWMKLSW